MASFASSATTCGARKHAWTKKKKSERWWSQWPSYAWHTQARMGHASRLGQKLKAIVAIFYIIAIGLLHLFGVTYIATA